jgi:tRNA A-37 threonylcarbamoyl transferase component Bud32
MQNPGPAPILDEYRFRPGEGVAAEQASSWLERLRCWPPSAPLPGREALSAGDVFRLDLGDGAVVLKRKRESGVKGLLALAGLREPQLLRSFRLGQQVLAAGLHTPQPLLYAQRRLGAGIETLLITRFVPGVAPWTLLEQDWLAPPMLDSLGSELASWHAAGFRHRDLKGPNLLYQSATGGSVLLDHAGVSFHGSRLSLQHRAQDLARLRSSALAAGIVSGQWQRLLASYLRRSRLLGSAILDDRDFLGSIEHFVQLKLARCRKLNKPLS